MNLQMEISHRQVLIQNLTQGGLCCHLLTQLLLSQLLLTQLSARLTDLMPAARLSGIGLYRGGDSEFAGNGLPVLLQ